jgi:hypothetical protein
MIGKLSIFSTPSRNRRPLDIDSDEDSEAVLKKLAARKKKNAKPQPPPRFYELSNTSEGVLVTDTQDGPWAFLLKPKDLQGYDSPLDQIFGKVEGRSVLSVDGVQFVEEHAGPANLVRIFGMLRPKVTAAD